MECLERALRAVIKMVQELRHLYNEQRLLHLRLTTLEERTRGDPIETCKIMSGSEAVNREQLFQLPACEHNLIGHSMKLSKQTASLDVHKFFFSQRVVNG